jgi:hypothetical protein
VYTDNAYTAEAGTGGLRIQALEMPYESDPLSANTMATALQAIASSNTRRGCRVKFHANKSAALMWAGLTGYISYQRWTIEETQAHIIGDYFINGTKQTISMGNRLDVEWLCEPVGAY